MKDIANLNGRAAASIPNPALEVRDLRLALALSAAHTTAQAATLLHLTQPAVSRALLAMEDRLGTRLFDRTTRGLVPTAAGVRLIADASRLLLELRDLEHRLKAPIVRPSRMRVVCECYTAYHWLPSVLATLRKSLPDFCVELAVEHTSSPIEALEAGEIDAALVTSASLPSDPRFEERALFSDEIIFVVAADHPLAKKKTLTRTDLRNNPILTARASPGETRWFMRRVFGRARPRLNFEIVQLTEAIVDMARAGMGIAILTEWIASPHLAKHDLVVKRLAGGPLMRPWRFFWRRDVGDAAERLFNALIATAPS